MLRQFILFFLLSTTLFYSVQSMIDIDENKKNNNEWFTIITRTLASQSDYKKVPPSEEKLLINVIQKTLARYPWLNDTVQKLENKNCFMSCAKSYLSLIMQNNFDVIGSHCAVCLILTAALLTLQGFFLQHNKGHEIYWFSKDNFHISD